MASYITAQQHMYSTFLIRGNLSFYFKKVKKKKKHFLVKSKD